MSCTRYYFGNKINLRGLNARATNYSTGIECQGNKSFYQN